MNNNLIVCTKQPKSCVQANLASDFIPMRKKIGSTTYKVNVHFSKNGGENMNDKILRLIQNETGNTQGG